MSERVRWVEHKGIRMLFADYAGLQDEGEYLEAIGEMETVLLEQLQGHRVPLLIDISNTCLTPAVTRRSQEMAAGAKAHGIPDSPTVLVGKMSGFQRATIAGMKFFRPDLHVAENIQDAKDWLAEQMAE
jgi:hypothetical protein